jgi:spermidine synthase
MPSILALFALTLAILAQELALIRWLPAQMRVLAYFPNLVLIAAFFGLGVGCLLARYAPRPWLWPLSLLLVVAAAAAAGGVAFTDNSTTEHLWLLYYDLPKDAPVIAGVRIPVFIAFVLCAASFVVPGQMLARRLDEFASVGRPLTGYATDLAGSLAGVLLFTILSWQQTFPIMWFAVLMLAMLPLLGGGPRQWAAHLSMAIAIIALVQAVERADFYSPYYALRAEPRAADASTPAFLSTNGSLHQVPSVVARGAPVATGSEARIREGFHLPFDKLGRAPGRALVLGAGTGNDVAVLLDRGATHVDAVEIDPVILRLGETLHPDRPYDSPKVRRINTDARSFLEDTEERYDLIVFGTLDSMTRLSALSNVRLDNFVYTVESLRAAYSLLTEDGGLVLYFMVGTPYIAEHLTHMLTLATGREPSFVDFHNGLFNVVFMVGPAFDHLQPASADVNHAGAVAAINPRLVPSDDWPYLYLGERSIGSFYLSLLAAIAVFALIVVLLVSPKLRAGVGRRGGIDYEMFLLGFGFLLLETRFVTGIGLLWGVTWIASAVVFAAILATMLLATLVTAWRPLPWSLASVGLALSLVVAWALPPGLLLTPSIPLKLLFTVLYVGVPVFLASCCFALRFRTREDAGTAFGWNLLGAVFGGLAEFASMALGFRALFLVALIVYLIAFLIAGRGTPVTAGRPALAPGAA